MVRGFIYAVFFIVFAASIACASESLTLSEAYALALKHHERAGIAALAVEQSELSVDKAYAGALPTVTADARYTRYSESETAEGGTVLLQPDDYGQFELKVSQTLFQGGKVLSAIRSARKFRAGVETSRDAASEDILINTARAYFSALTAEKELGIKRAALKRAEEHGRVSEARLRAGTATKTVVLRADAEVARMSAEVTDAELSLKNALEVVRRFTGVEGDIIVAEPEPEALAVAPVSELVAVALEKRRDYIVRKIDEELAEEGVRYAWGGFLPTIAIDGVYTYRDQTPDSGYFLNDSFRADLTLSYPLFEGGLRRAELGEARTRVREAELRRIGLRRDIELEVRTAHNAVETLKSVIESQRKEADFAAQNYDMVFKQFTHGLADSVDVVDADSALVSAQEGLSEAVLRHQLSMLELKKSMGALLDEARRGGADGLVQVNSNKQTEVSR
jgi:outer membrane protein